MQDYQKRVLEEINDLDAKLTKLLAFLNERGSSIDREDLALLRAQSTAMQTYYQILAMRVERFK